MSSKKNKAEKEVETISPADVGSAEAVLGDLVEGAETRVLPVEAPVAPEETPHDVLMKQDPPDSARHSKRSAT